MKISVIMVDGGFRENVFAAKYFSDQDFPDDQYEVIWVEYYDKSNEQINEIAKVKTIELNKTGIYHSSYCFNEGIRFASGEIIVIPDADQIVESGFLKRVYENHMKINNLVCYGFRFDEMKKGALKSHEFTELREKCRLKNPSNYGGCLTVRKSVLMSINGYEQHVIFGSGFHANGLDLYTRFKNLGLPIMWDRELVLYHPWHDFTLSNANEYELQKKLIDWRAKNLQYMALKGIDENKDTLKLYREVIEDICDSEAFKTVKVIKKSKTGIIKSLIKRVNTAIVD